MRIGDAERKSPHPAFGHLPPSFGRGKATIFEIIPFSRYEGMGEGAQRADEGLSPRVELSPLFSATKQDSRDDSHHLA
jgi:hypothetical protein